MFRSFISFSLTAIIFLVISCNQHSASTNDDQDGLSSFNADSMRKHDSMLASDSFEGRKPFTRAEEKTINYIRDEFMTTGLEPGNGNSYFQEVPMVNIQTNAAPTMQVRIIKGKF